MAKNVIEFSYEVNGKVCKFYCDPDCPVISAKEAVSRLMKDLALIEENALAQAKEAECKKDECNPDECVNSGEENDK